MGRVQDLRMLMSYSDPLAMATTRRLQRIARFTTFVFVPLYVASLIAIGYGFYRVWQTGDWQHIWDATKDNFSYLIVATFVIPLLLVERTTRELHGVFPALERAAATGDGRLAPLATHQPEPSAYDSFARMCITFGPLRYLDDWAAPYQGMAGWILGIMVCAVFGLALLAAAGIVLLWLPATSPGLLAVQIIVSALLIVLGGVLLWLGIAGWRQIHNSRRMIRRLREGLRVQADADGLRWVEARTGEEQALPWSEARAFYMVAPQYEIAPQYEPARGYSAPIAQRRAAILRALGGMHVLAGGQTRLVWLTPTPREPDAQVEHQQLCRLIATHTRLPLRDISAANAAIARALRTTTNGKALPPDEQTTLDALGVPVDATTLERVRRKTRRLSWLTVALLAPYLVIVLVGVVGSILQHVGIG